MVATAGAAVGHDAVSHRPHQLVRVFLDGVVVLQGGGQGLMHRAGEHTG